MGVGEWNLHEIYAGRLRLLAFISELVAEFGRSADHLSPDVLKRLDHARNVWLGGEAKDPLPKVRAFRRVLQIVAEFDPSWLGREQSRWRWGAEQRARGRSLRSPAEYRRRRLSCPAC